MCQVTNPDKIQVKIANPAPGGRTHTSLANARTYEYSGAGYFFNGQFVFARGDENERKLRRLYQRSFRKLQPNELSEESAVIRFWPDSKGRR